MPTLSEIFAAAQGRFEPILMRNDRADYERTCRVWARRLSACRAEAESLAGKEVYARFQRYLKAAAGLFHFEYTYLLRIVFQRHDEPRGIA